MKEDDSTTIDTTSKPSEKEEEEKENDPNDLKSYSSKSSQDFSNEFIINSLEIKLKSTKISQILKNFIQTSSNPDEDLLQFDIMLETVEKFKWTVYHKAIEIRENMNSIQTEISIENIRINAKIQQIINNLKNSSIDSILMDKEKMKEVEKGYTDLLLDLKDSSFYLMEFFNISLGSFSHYNGGKKPLEGYIEKKSDPRIYRKLLGIVCPCIDSFIFSKYNKRWFVLKDDMIYYSNSSQIATGKNVYWFDSGVQLIREGKTNLSIINVSRTLSLKFKSYFEREIWFEEINSRVQKFVNSISSNIYKSYAIEKEMNLCHWFVDGKSYFEDLYEKLLNAKETVFITDWWLSPEVYLIRPVNEGIYLEIDQKKASIDEIKQLTRLMDVLNKVAEIGVKVYIQVYCECSLALTLNSKHSEDAIIKLNKKIQVTRHPKDALDLLWSHHEKLVIIDQMIGYVGGLDLCWGRYDTNDHPLIEEENNEKNYLFPGIDYSNARICDFNNVQNYLVESIPRKKCRMPWHDVHSRIEGPAVVDIARHFVERWNYTKFNDKSEGITEVKNVIISNSSKKKNKISESWIGKIIGKVSKSKDKKKNIKTESELNKEKTIKMVKEIVVEKEKEENEPKTLQEKGLLIHKKKMLESPIEVSNTESGNQNEIDTNIEFKLETDEINTSQKHSNNQISFTDSINVEQPIEESNIIEEKIGEVDLKKLEDNFLKDKIIIDDDHLMLPSKAKLKSGQNKDYYSKMIKKYGETQKKKNKIIEILKNEERLESKFHFSDFYKKGTRASVQVLRSACYWSVGVTIPEHSILNAYYHLIDTSEHYIYIENQFFVSKSFTEEERKKCKNATSQVVENEIALHIRNRIERAYKNKEKFHVYIFIPLLPGFAGEPEESSTLQIILKHTYAGICRNYGLSIIEQLEKIMGDEWRNYIGFYSLRTHALIDNIPQTELIYIHSKLMIIDDTTVLLGSANINDRSMLGTRDSEFAVIIKEKKRVNMKMNGNNFIGAKFAIGFRKACMSEHLGIKNDDPILDDPVSDNLINCFKTSAKNNTYLYSQIFGCYPDDKYKSFSDLKEFYKNKTIEDYNNLIKLYEQKKDSFKGHIVEFPLHFLEKENLGIGFFTVENLVPERNFT